VRAAIPVVNSAAAAPSMALLPPATSRSAPSAALLAFMSAIRQAQAEATKLAQQAGIAHAQATERVYLGRKPSYTREQLVRFLDLLATVSDIAICKQVGLDRLVVRRVRAARLSASGTTTKIASAVAIDGPSRP
jgi:hypothetical protein